MMLANAIAALESPEHDADVNEAEAIRERLLDLDAAIGERIQAKLDAHRLIIDQWGVSEVVVPRKLEEAKTNPSSALKTRWQPATQKLSECCSASEMRTSPRNIMSRPLTHGKHTGKNMQANTH
jgi:hypothetical protein